MNIGLTLDVLTVIVGRQRSVLVVGTFVVESRFDS